MKIEDLQKVKELKNKYSVLADRHSTLTSIATCNSKFPNAQRLMLGYPNGLKSELSQDYARVLCVYVVSQMEGVLAELKGLGVDCTNIAPVLPVTLEEPS